jgi:hypothetical protein
LTVQTLVPFAFGELAQRFAAHLNGFEMTSSRWVFWVLIETKYGPGGFNGLHTEDAL